MEARTGGRGEAGNPNSESNRLSAGDRSMKTFYLQIAASRDFYFGGMTLLHTCVIHVAGPRYAVETTWALFLVSVTASPAGLLPLSLPHPVTHTHTRSGSLNLAMN